MESIEEVNRRFNEELELFSHGKQITDLHLGRPSEILLASGLQDTEIYIAPKTLNRHLLKHGFTVNDIKDLPYAMGNPLLVYEWGVNAKSLIVITHKLFGDDKVTAAIKLERKGERLQVNELAGIHPKAVQRFMQEMSQAKEGGLQEALRYVPEKKKVLDWLGLVPPKGTASLTDQELSIAKVIQNFQNPPLKNQKTMETIEQERKQYISYYPYGDLYKIEEKRNGKRDGLYREYYGDGRIAREWNYKDGVPHGLNREWRPDGTLEYMRNFKDGKLEGVRRQYFENGRIFKEENYKEGKLEGLTRVWHPDGRFNFEQNYHNGEVISKPETVMERKYEFTGETLQHEGHTLHQIRAVDDLPGDDMYDIPPVKKGELGGWIEKEENLSHRGFCWVGGEAKVWGNVQIHDNAQVRGHAEVSQGVIVENTAIIDDKAKISGNAQIFGHSFVGDEAQVRAKAMIGGENVCISGRAHITDGAYVSGAAIVGDDAVVKDKATIDGTAVIGGKAEVSGNALVAGMARVEENAVVSCEAKVLDDAEIYEKARVTGYARVEGAKVGGSDVLSGTTCLQEKKEWNKAGIMTKIVTYLNGKMEGECMTCYPNGNTKEIITYKNGVKEGLYEAWHENREMKERAYYKNDLRHGLYESWNEEGKRTVRRVFKNGEEVKNPLQKLFKPKKRGLGF